MGKPFEKELKSLPSTLDWAFSEPINPALEKIVATIRPFPLFVVGSGGSLSGAHFVARIHEEITGKMARAITPFELTFSQADPSLHAVLILTAGGGNKDVLSIFKEVVNREFAAISLVCAKVGSKIGQKAKNYPNALIYEYPNPSGKDGFLAVNSLISSCILIAKAYEAFNFSEVSVQELTSPKIDFESSEWDNFLNRKTILALGGEWAWPGVVDLESKFTEAALGKVLISDLRNFGHGRHNWFDKNGEESALLSLVTPHIDSLAQKIANVLPKQFPRAFLRSSHNGPIAAIDLLMQVFLLVHEVGKRANIDPGRPKVPDFGRKIYHISPLSRFSTGKLKNRDVWLERKAKVTKQSPNLFEESLEKFLSLLRQSHFSGIVFDYDGTLCDPPERYTQPNAEIALALNNLLSKEIVIGIATGRGHTAQESLRNVIEEKYWDKVLIGNYNGSIIVKLNCDLPKKGGETSEIIKDIHKVLTNDCLLVKQADIEEKAKQISIMPKAGFTKQTALERLYEILYKFEKIKFVQSDHSIDILSPEVSKVHVIEKIREILKHPNEDILVIGDQGQFGGNDFEMLTLPYSLSVNKVSSSMDTCWNLSPPGVTGAKATMCILNALSGENGKIRLDAVYLEKRKGK